MRKVFKVNSKSVMNRALALSVLVSILLILTLWRYSPWMPGVFYGDDLSNYIAFLDGKYASTPWQALTGQYVEKYRPVFALFLGGLFACFGSAIKNYQVVNVLINVLSGLIVFAITFKISRGNVLVAFLSSVIALTSRFALYQVSQVTGVIEGLANVFFWRCFTF